MNYESKDDFKEISNCFSLDGEALLKLEEKLDGKTILKLEKIKGKVFKGRALFMEEIANILDFKIYKDRGWIVCQACDLGRRKFQKKLKWVKKYQQDLLNYSQMLEMVKILFELVKNQGLKKDSVLLFEKSIKHIKLRERCQNFTNNIIEYLKTETSQIMPGETLLASSDILESILGKYKMFSSGCPLKEIGKMLLTIPLCTIELAAAIVKQAMEKIRNCDVDDWANKVLGPSMLSKRRAIFNS